jgi:flagellar protein FlbD
VINVTRLNGGKVVINAELIELVEALPDTTITLQNGHKYIVAEALDEIIERTLTYRRALNAPLSACQ